MIFLYLALIPLSFTTESLFEDPEGSTSGSGPSANFVGDSLYPDTFISHLAPSAFIPSNEQALASSDPVNSGDLFTILPDLDDSSATRSSSSPSIFDEGNTSPEPFVGPSAGDIGFTSSDILQSTDMNPNIASSELNLIAQGTIDPGMATEYDVAQLFDSNGLAFPALRKTLRELFIINSQDPGQSSAVCPAAWQRRPECPPGKFPFCCLEGPPLRVPAKQDRRGACFTCGLAQFLCFSVPFLSEKKENSRAIVY